VRGQALAGVGCRRRQKKYENPQSTPVAAGALKRLSYFLWRGLQGAPASA